ncbi:MAG TPA: hypothetical protein VF115_04755 [Acidimicrobiia bacterium]
MSKLVRRYRKDNLSKATKPFRPVFSITTDDVLGDLTNVRA